MCRRVLFMSQYYLLAVAVMSCVGKKAKLQSLLLSKGCLRVGLERLVEYYPSDIRGQNASTTTVVVDDSLATSSHGMQV